MPSPGRKPGALCIQRSRRNGWQPGANERTQIAREFARVAVCRHHALPLMTWRGGGHYAAAMRPAGYDVTLTFQLLFAP